MLAKVKSLAFAGRLGAFTNTSSMEKSRLFQISYNSARPTPSVGSALHGGQSEKRQRVTVTSGLGRGAGRWAKNSLNAPRPAERRRDGEGADTPRSARHEAPEPTETVGWPLLAEVFWAI